MTNKWQNQSGQIGIVLILAAVALVGIGISIGTDTAEQLLTTVQTQESDIVFSGAESGIETALSEINQAEQNSQNVNEVTDRAITVDGTNVKYSIDKKSVLENKLIQGYSFELPLDGLGSGDQIEIDWSKEDDCNQNPAALIVSIYYESGGDSRVKHYGIDGFGCNRNSFPNASKISGTYKFHYAISIPSSNPTVARIKAIYNDTDIKVSGLNSTAQYGILSRAQSGEAGSETKSILVERTVPAAPEFMDYALVSGTNIIK